MDVKENLEDISLPKIRTFARTDRARTRIVRTAYKYELRWRGQLL
jgi:hypothetical protein